MDAIPTAALACPCPAPNPSARIRAESAALLTMLAAAGMRWLNMSVALPSTSPHLQRPSAYPPGDGYAPPENPMHSLVRHIQVVREMCKAAPAM